MKDRVTPLLDEVQALRETATIGPWEALEGNEAWIVDTPAGVISWDDHGGDVFTEGDAKFIAASGEYMPKFASALRAVMKEHSPVSVDVVDQFCAEGACDHDAEEECRYGTVVVCSGCLELAESAWTYYGESGLTEVEYPCPTVQAVIDALATRSDG